MFFGSSFSLFRRARRTKGGYVFTELLASFRRPRSWRSMGGSPKHLWLRTVVAFNNDDTCLVNPSANFFKPAFRHIFAGQHLHE